VPDAAEIRFLTLPEARLRIEYTRADFPGARAGSVPHGRAMTGLHRA
jgi:hypothetical protein